MNKLILIFFIFLLACQTAPKRYQSVMEGEWQAKVLIKDKKQAQSHIVNIAIKAIQNSALRIDVTTPAGLHVASLAMQGNELEYVLMQDKKFIRGRANPKALTPLIRVPMDPLILQNIVFDLPIESANWKCQFDEKKYLTDCENKTEKMKIEWRDRKQTTKLVKVMHPLAELQMKFLSFQAHVSNREKAFKLKVPKNFKVYRLR
ncbi:MAG: DUF4292 domain-containing protein [Bdellovibrionales bacterium]|nr:DUF4292 domain-containing protein [Bdellovibrionales bacterium]